MNARNRTLVTVVRILFGLMFVFSGVSGLMAGFSGLKGIPDQMLPSTQALWNMGLFQMIKVTEVVSGLMLVTGFLPALAVIFLAPLAVGIVIYNSQIAPAFVPTGLVVCAFEIYFGYVYWEKYRALFNPK
jgi:uncharacterized membrane protein YphA (DoxX/SURF4 family)